MAGRGSRKTYVGPQVGGLLVESTKGTIIHRGLVQSHGIYELFHQRHFRHQPDRVLDHKNQVWMDGFRFVDQLCHFREEMVVLQGLGGLFELFGFRVSVFAA